MKTSKVFEFKTENSAASDPTRVCLCTNSMLNKNETEKHVEVFPGQTFEIEAVAVGQRYQHPSEQKLELISLISYKSYRIQEVTVQN